MRLAPPALLALVATVVSGCTIHVVEQPAATAWSAPPPVLAPVPAPVAAPHGTPRPSPTPAVREPRRRVASSARPSDFGRVTTPAPSSKPEPVVRPEPRPEPRPIPTKPDGVFKPDPARPNPNPVTTEKPRGRYPFRLTRPEPRRPELADTRGKADDRRVRPPVAAVR